MSFQKYNRQSQVKGSFDNGNIQENKPLGFQQEGGKLTPYSNLFYWAHAWSDEGGLIAEHPHRGFEILSFVIQGQIQHFDSKINKWLSLNKGDVQIIHSGKGITHAEKFGKNSKIFQIWFDPDLKKTWFKDASYAHYHCSEFPVKKSNTSEVITIKGSNSPLSMDTPFVEIYKMKFNVGLHMLDFNTDQVYSIYVMNGKLNFNEKHNLETDDFVVIENESQSELIVHDETEVFMISTAARLPYKTFAELSD